MYLTHLDIFLQLTKAKRDRSSKFLINELTER